MGALDPVSSQEIEAVVAAVREALPNGEHASFSSAGLAEPAKEAVQGGGDVARVVRVLGVDGQDDGGFRADVDVANGEVVSLDRLDASAQGAYTFLELFMAIELTRSNEEWLAAMRARDIAVIAKARKDMEKIVMKAVKGMEFPQALLDVIFFRGPDAS